MSEVLDTCRKVAEKSRQVRIDREALGRFCAEWLSRGLDVPAWDSFHHFQGTPGETAAYLLLLDTLNFCFWPASGSAKWEIQYGSEWFSGYYGLALALKKAVESGFPLTDARTLAGISPEALKGILAGRGELQLLPQRLSALRELGLLLSEAYDGKARDLIASAGGSALKLTRLLAGGLASFRDRALYDGEEVFFYKRAQILAADLFAAFDGKGLGDFKDMEILTAFADYKLPQVLRQAGVLVYDGPLSLKVDQGVLIDAGGPEEVEIRANTLWAVELIRQELKRAGKNLRSFEIDWALWNLGQQEAFRVKPYHRTVTIFY
ncbi:MAG: queuosine salvage family protein [Pseudomonadota bacterium]